jgi:hypothetical protein
MSQSTATEQAGQAPTAIAEPAHPPAEPAKPPPRVAEVVRRFKMELLSGRGIAQDRGSGFDPYDRGGSRDIWSRQRRA